ncbi:MAG: hypothetical protein FWG82_06175 [Oscillospiraceae bacterium]|nr:hypothetical protein [Oscillospiraceae bacterium]
MFGDSVDYAKGETPMTDFQFQKFIELQEAKKSLEAENKTLRDKCEELTRELNLLREDKAE